MSTLHDVPSGETPLTVAQWSHGMRVGILGPGLMGGKPGTIRDAEFEPVDADSLRIARYIEPFALLIAELAYGGAGGPEPAYRFERLPSAPRQKSGR